MKRNLFCLVLGTKQKLDFSSEGAFAALGVLGVLAVMAFGISLETFHEPRVIR